jgi:hypothetical protein
LADPDKKGRHDPYCCGASEQLREKSSYLLPGLLCLWFKVNLSVLGQWGLKQGDHPCSAFREGSEISVIFPIKFHERCINKKAGTL